MEGIYLLQYGLYGSKTLYRALTSDSEPDKQILDPLSSLIRLALLTFKQKGTKISISNNRIYFQAPDILQGPKRWTWGDNRNDLHNLCSPIEKALEWYPCIDDPIMENMYRLAVKGLIKLKKSYIVKNIKIGDSNLVCHSIQHYITLIQNKLEQTQHGRQTGDGSEGVNNSLDVGIPAPQHYENTHFKNLWDVAEIEIVNGLLNLATTKQHAHREYTYAIKAIEDILSEKDANVVKIISKIMTSI